MVGGYVGVIVVRYVGNRDGLWDGFTVGFAVGNVVVTAVVATDGLRVVGLKLGAAVQGGTWQLQVHVQYSFGGLQLQGDMDGDVEYCWVNTPDLCWSLLPNEKA
jgi:hypothetical protein